MNAGSQIKVLRDCRAGGIHYARGQIVEVGSQISFEHAQMLVRLSMAESLPDAPAPTDEQKKPRRSTKTMAATEAATQ